MLPEHIRVRLLDEVQASEADTADLVNYAVWQADELISHGGKYPSATREVAALLVPAFRYLSELSMVELVSCLPHIKQIVPARGMVARRQIENFLFDMEEIVDAKMGRPLKDRGTVDFADYLLSLWAEVTGRPGGVGGGKRSMINTYRLIFWNAPALVSHRDRDGWDGEREIESWLDAIRRAVKRKRSRQVKTEPKVS